MPFCSKCGKEILGKSNFCMHCGADLSENKGGFALNWKQKPKKYAEIVSLINKFPHKKELEAYTKVKNAGKLPIFKGMDLVRLRDEDLYTKSFCPLCGNYASFEGLEDYQTLIFGMKGMYKVSKSENGEEREVYANYSPQVCLACNGMFFMINNSTFEKECPTQI